MIEIIRARAAVDFAEARSLFTEYAGTLGFNLCFQNFDRELERMEELYQPPAGELLLARDSTGFYCGCVGVKRFDEMSCEMKRLYVRDAYRGHRAGSRLVSESIVVARELGYQIMRLDTIRDKMQTAIDLYFKEGFIEIPPYYLNPLDNVLYMEKAL